MTWPAFPKRLQSALTALCCLAQSGQEIQCHEIAERIQVPLAETAKILQLLVWGGFVTSRRGSKGGFQLASPADQITMGEVINFFLTRHAAEPQKSSSVMRTLYDCMAPCQNEFAELSLAAVTKRAETRSSRTRTLSGPNKSSRVRGSHAKLTS